jgi:thiol-disulfide isomerase/thioredoxin
MDTAIVTMQRPDHLQNFFQNNKGPSTVFLSMNGCGFCKSMQPEFEKLANDPQFKHITFYQGDGPTLQADEHASNILSQEINGYPTLYFFNEGELVDTQVGAAPAQVIIQKLNNLSDQPGLKSKPKSTKKSSRNR